MNAAADIAFLCADPGIPPDGHKGASVHFRAMAAAMARAGATLDVVMARAGDLGGFHPHRGTTVPTPRGSGIAGELQQLGHATALLAALRQRGPHRAVYERLSLFAGAGLAYARELGVPYAVEVNAPLWEEASRFRTLHLRHAARGLCLDVLQQADLVLPVSDDLAAELVAQGVPAAAVQVLGNGADTAAFAAAAPAEPPAPLRGRPLLLFVGSLKPWHGIGFLLRAFAALRQRCDVALWIVGDGPEAAAIDAVARPGSGIVRSPAVPHAQIPGILQAADVVLAPYPGDAPAYFSPLKVVEALAARRPVVGSRVPCVLAGLREAGIGREHPGLFAADDVADFVRVVQAVLATPGPATATPAQAAGLDWQVRAARVLDRLGLATTATTTAKGARHGG